MRSNRSCRVARQIGHNVTNLTEGGEGGVGGGGGGGTSPGNNDLLANTGQPIFSQGTTPILVK